MTQFHSIIFRTLGFMLLALGLAMVMNRPAAAAALKPSAVVTGSTITLGDVVDGDMGASAEISVASAPAPGKRSVIAVQTVANIAYTHGVAISNPAKISRIVVERAGTTVPEDVIKERLAERLQGLGVEGRFDIRFAGRNLALAVPLGAPADVTIEDLQYDPVSGRFQARLSAPAGNGRAAEAQVYGSVEPLTEIPVLAERMNKDDVIGEADILWITMPKTRVPQGVVTDSADLVGKSPRRLLAAERPVRLRDIRNPVVVAKGSMVTMVVKAPGLTLTTVGRALEEGSMGDMIRVVNADTHQTISAAVIGPGKVRPGVAIGTVTAQLTQ